MICAAKNDLIRCRWPDELSKLDIGRALKAKLAGFYKRRTFSRTKDRRCLHTLSKQGKEKHRYLDVSKHDHSAEGFQKEEKLGPPTLPWRYFRYFRRVLFRRRSFRRGPPFQTRTTIASEHLLFRRRWRLRERKSKLLWEAEKKNFESPRFVICFCWHTM